MFDFFKVDHSFISIGPFKVGHPKHQFIWDLYKNGQKITDLRNFFSDVGFFYFLKINSPLGNTQGFFYESWD